MHESRNLDHLGIVAAVCNEIKLEQEINKIIGIDPRQKITCGQAVKAMVLNTLGFVDRPLYLSPEFLKTKPIELLIGKGLKADNFNDDCLGRTLDKMYDAGLEEVFMRVAAKAQKYEGDTRFYHSDTTSISLQGEYTPANGDIDAAPIKITHGFSKDKRPDLKQFVVSLITGRYLPMFIQTLSGNTSDKEHFRTVAKTYGESLNKIWSDNRIWVWDSAFYTKDNVKYVPKKLRWITRVPETLTDAKELISTVDSARFKETTSLKGYHLFCTEMMYGGVRQRWILVFSEKAYAREMKTMDKQICKEREMVDKKLWHFSRQEFNCKKDGLQALKALQKKWRYHKTADVRVNVEKMKAVGGRGRPKKEDDLKHVFSVHAGFEQDENAVQQALMRKGRFIIATNVLDRRLSDEEIVQGYKDQQHVERGFRFLKDPLFFAHSLFLKKEERIMAMVMLMGLGLLVYSLAERKLRMTLKQLDETVPDQKGKPTDHPTIRRMFQVFEGISVLYDNQGILLEVMNVRETPRKVLSLFGRDYEMLYGIGI
jgi:transposase